MPIEIIRHDITRVAADAIVNAANPTLLGGGGVDGCIHRAAGPQLLEECRTLGGCPPGQARVTKGYRLPCRYVIHTVGPRWQGGTAGEKECLLSCYRHALALARQYECGSIAFPLISAGIYGYPREEALQVAMQAFEEFLQQHEMQIYLVVFDRESVQIGEKRYQKIRRYIDANYVEEIHAQDRRRRPEPQDYDRPLSPARVSETEPRDFAPAASAQAPAPAQMLSLTLEEALRQRDEGFSAMLLRKIGEKGMTDSQCYKRANIDRRLFSKIRSDPAYQPSKPTVLAFAVSLRLSLRETRALLESAGYALSHSSKFDIIVEYFIRQREYDIFAINETLFAFDQNLLGGR